MKYVFLQYLNRSGSTFLANQLSKNADILVCPEAEVLVNILAKKSSSPLNSFDHIKLNTAVTADRKLKYWGLDLAILMDSAENRLDLFFSILDQYHSKTKPQSQVIVFKAVDLINCMDVLHAYGIEKGLDIYFINLIRDPRAIYNSQRNTYVASKRRFMNRNPLFTVYQWEHLFSRSYDQHFIKRLCIIKYEDLINDQVGELNKITEFIGITGAPSNENIKGDLIGRIPEDQLAMHPNIEDQPIAEYAVKWESELKHSFQYFIQRLTAADLARMEYNVKLVRNIIRIQFFLLWLGFKVDLVMKGIYKRFRGKS